MEILKAIILGIVEGLTEFLPVSSTGHLILVNQFVTFDEQFTKMFDVFIQFGAILAVILFFRKKLFNVFDENRKFNPVTIDLWKKVIVGVLPALAIGAVCNDVIEELLFNPITVAIALVIGGIVLVLIERGDRKAHIESIAELSYKTAIFIGLIQCMAMVPGTSRSAATVIGAMLLGCSRVVAVEYSFYLAIPTIMAASAYSFLKLFLKSGLAISSQQVTVLAAGFITAFLVAWAVIAVFMRYIAKKDFRPFGYYRIVLGAIVLGYFLIVI